MIAFPTKCNENSSRSCVFSENQKCAKLKKSGFKPSNSNDAPFSALFFGDCPREVCPREVSPRGVPERSLRETTETAVLSLPWPC